MTRRCVIKKHQSVRSTHEEECIASPIGFFLLEKKNRKENNARRLRGLNVRAVRSKWIDCCPKWQGTKFSVVVVVPSIKSQRMFKSVGESAHFFLPQPLLLRTRARLFVSIIDWRGSVTPNSSLASTCATHRSRREWWFGKKKRKEKKSRENELFLDGNSSLFFTFMDNIPMSLIFMSYFYLEFRQMGTEWGRKKKEAGRIIMTINGRRRFGRNRERQHKTKDDLYIYIYKTRVCVYLYIVIFPHAHRM